MSTKLISSRLLSKSLYRPELYSTSGLRQHFDAYDGTISTSTWTDKKGYGNITFANSPTVSTSSTSSSNFVTFNGSTQYGTGIDLAGLSTFSMYLWVKTTSTATGTPYYLYPSIGGVQTAGAGSNDVVITMNSGQIGIYSGLNGGGVDNQNVSGNVAINNGLWYEICVTSSFTNGTKLFANTAQVGSALPASVNVTSADGVNIGRAGNPGGYAYGAFSCAVAMFYTKELTAAERQSNWYYYRNRFNR